MYESWRLVYNQLKTVSGNIERVGTKQRRMSGHDRCKSNL